MVLRRQYRHLREELSKLKVPEGLHDLDVPFNPNVTLPAMTDSSINSSGAITVPKSNTETSGTTNVPSTTTSPSVNANIGPESTKTSDAFVNKTSDNQNQVTEIQSINTTPLAPLEINTQQSFINCAMEDDSDDTPAILSQNTLPSNEIITHNEPLLPNDIETGEGEEEDAEDIIANESEELDVSDYKCNTVDELMEQLFFDTSENAMQYDD